MTTKQKIYERMEFDNFDEFLTQVEVPVTKMSRIAWQKECGDSLASEETGGYRTKWSGSKDYHEAVRFARDGWAVGTDHLSPVVDALAPYVMAAQRIKGEDMSVAGYLPDVALFCAGDPAHMYQAGDQIPARARVLRMLVNLSSNCNVEPDHMINRGAAISAVIDYLENTGTRVEIQAALAIEGWYGGKSYIEVMVPVKQADQQTEPDRLAFTLSNPAMLRRFMFRLMEQKGHLAPSMGSGYGHAIDVKAAPDQIYFPAGCHNCETPIMALKTVLGQVAQFIGPEQKELLDADWQALLQGTDSLAY